MTTASSRNAGPRARLRTRALRPNDWPIIERLFGPKGACGGCWCMLWRAPKGGSAFEESKGEKNRRAFKRLVTTGRVYGVLAFAGDEPVGWCSIGPRADFPGLQRSRVLQTDWRDGTWSVTCFYIPARWRHKGVATALLKEAVKLARANGARELEAYPVRVKAAGGDMPAAFAWTGVPALFDKHKFTNIAPPGHSREIYVRRFHHSRQDRQLR